MKRLIPCFVPGLLAVLSTACGSLSDGQDPALLATIQGQLTNTQSIDTPATIRVAVLWQSAHERGGFTVAQDVEVEPVFPSKFKLALTAAPPDAAMLTPGTRDYQDDPPPSAGGQYPSSGDDGDDDDEGDDTSTPSSGRGPTPQDFDVDDGPSDMRIGYGFLVAYEDTNGNGKLDLVDEDATEFVDRVLGANPEMMVVYAEGNLNHPELVNPHGTHLKAGYNLFRLRECATTDELAPEPPDDGDDTAEVDDPGFSQSSCEPDFAWLPIETLYELPITSDPEFSALMCKDGGGSHDSVSQTGGGRAGSDGAPVNTDPGPAGYPSADQVTCRLGGRAYDQTECTSTDHGPCRGTSTECVSRAVGLLQGDVPQGWPCALQP